MAQIELKLTGSFKQMKEAHSNSSVFSIREFFCETCDLEVEDIKNQWTVKIRTPENFVTKLKKLKTISSYLKLDNKLSTFFR